MSWRGTCGVDLLFDIGSLLVEVGGLASFALLVALDALEVGSG